MLAIAFGGFVFAGCTPNADVKVVEIEKPDSAVDASVGIKSLPKPIDRASADVQALAPAVAQVVKVNFASGTGFFISPDGLFLTNEHVIPIEICAERRCPGVKIVTGLRKGGTVRVYTDFIVLAQSKGEYDFSLLKVKLAAGEKVDFLALDESPIQYDSNWDGSQHVAVGHPMGAPQHYAEVRPTNNEGVTVQLDGVVLHGNSGGPIVDLKTRKVIGLTKTISNQAMKKLSSSTYHRHKNQAVSIHELLKHVQEVVGVPLLSIGEYTNTGKLNAAAGPRPTPDEETFGGVLRKGAKTDKFTSALAQFSLVVGTPDEEKALALMLKKSKRAVGEINATSLNQLLNLGLQVGRPLKFSDKDALEIERALPSPRLPWSSSWDVNGFGMHILWHYFEPESRAKFRTECLSATPDDNSLALYIPFLCGSTRTKDNQSVFAVALGSLTKQGGFADGESAERISSLLFGSVAIGVESRADIEAIEAIQRFAISKMPSLEKSLQADSIVSLLAHRLYGVGAFANTFPK